MRAGLSRRKALEMTPAEFIAAIGPAAAESAKVTGIPASFTIAQAALESSWGASLLSREACNLFGVKGDSSWHGPTMELATREYLAGKWVTVPAKWRKYANWLEAIADHAKFLLGNPRYKLAFTGQRAGEDFARMVQACGYATDPRYADKVGSIIHQHQLDRFDGARP